jgi:hypothetical protein
MATTAEAIVYGAFDLIGVLQAGGTLNGNDLTDGYRRLQNFVRQLNLQTQANPFVGREVFPLIAGRGGPNDGGAVGGGPYTIGPGGDFNTERPAALYGAGLLLQQTTGAASRVEIPRTVYTVGGYNAIQIKDLPNQLFTGVYYQPTFSAGLGTIFLWPVPNTAINSLVLYRLDQLAPFASLTASYDLPPGYEEMFEYNLARRLAGPFQRKMTQENSDIARESLAFVKRANRKIVDLAIDPALTKDRRGWYNIETSNY